MSSSYDMSDVHAWGRSGLTWPEFHRRQIRRRRLIRWTWYTVAVLGACLLIVAGLRVMFVIP